MLKIIYLNSQISYTYDQIAYTMVPPFESLLSLHPLQPRTSKGLVQIIGVPLLLPLSIHPSH